MRRPTWVCVTAALGILLASLAMVGSAQWAFAPRAEIESSGEKAVGRTSSFSWLKPLAPGAAWAEFAVSAFVAVASFLLLGMRRRNLRLYQGALALAALFHLARVANALASLSILGLPLVAGSLFWLVVVLGLALGVLLNDRSVFV